MSISPLLSHEKERKAKTPDFLKNSSHNHKAFTLIELLIVIAIIGVLSTLAIIALNSSRAGARDSKRLSDLRQVRTALELYYADNDTYPLSLTPGQPIIDDDGTVYMSAVPSNPSPRTDGTCPNDEYTYQSNGTAYGFFTCLGAAAGTLFAGGVVATPTGLESASLYPIIKATTTSAVGGGNVASHPVSLPGGIQIGDLLVIFIRTGNGVTALDVLAGWTVLTSRNSGSITTILYKIADGSEGSSVTITTTGSSRSAHVTYRISNVDPTNPISGSFAGSNVVNPPNLTTGWGAVPVLWIALASTNQGNNAFTAAPPNYHNLLSIVASNGGTNNNHVRIAAAHRFSTVASQDPGNFGTNGDITSPHAATIGINPKAF